MVMRSLRVALVLHSVAALRSSTLSMHSRRSFLGVAIPSAVALAPATANAAGLLEAGSGVQELLRPLYRAESKLQAGAYDRAAVAAAIRREIEGSPVLIYSYTLSPFCTEAKAILESAGAKAKVIELGAEWVPGLLSAESSAIRAELGEMTGQTSMPHIFIRGESIGGLFTGTPGLKPLLESGKLQAKLKVDGSAAPAGAI